jgi:ActR/RegA family two-component response regulator
LLSRYDFENLMREASIPAVTLLDRHRTPSVLIVDDDERVLATLRDLVLSLGYDTQMATTGVAALAAVKAHPPDTNASAVPDSGLGCDASALIVSGRCGRKRCAV